MKPTAEIAFETVFTEALLANGYQAIASGTFDRERAVFGVELHRARKRLRQQDAGDREQEDELDGGDEARHERRAPPRPDQLVL